MILSRLFYVNDSLVITIRSCMENQQENKPQTRLLSEGILGAVLDGILSGLFLGSVYGIYFIISMGMVWLLFPYLFLIYLGYKKVKKH